MAILFFIRQKVPQLLYPISLSSTSCGLWNSLVQHKLEESRNRAQFLAQEPQHAPDVPQSALHSPYSFRASAQFSGHGTPRQVDTWIVSQTAVTPKLCSTVQARISEAGQTQGF